MKKTYFLLLLLLPGIVAYSQKYPFYTTKTVALTKDNIKAKTANDSTSIEFEKPFNVFASAGPAVRLSTTYDVTISSVDNTVQFQKNSPLTSGISLGLVWTPFLDYGSTQQTLSVDTNGNTVKKSLNIPRHNFAMALLINVFQLSYTASQFNTSTPIDVGLGLGYRKDNFLILGTIEFMKTSQPRQYFIDQYMGQNKTLVLHGNTNPERTLSTSDNTIFTNTLIPALGLKLAYSFGKSPAKVTSTSIE
jgi:hypothetical protein